MAPRNAHTTRPPSAPLRRSSRARTPTIQLGPIGTTGHGRTKAGEATPVRRTTHAFTADVEPASVGSTRRGCMSDGELAVAPTSGQSASSRTSKRGHTEDDQDGGRGGKKACRVSLSNLFYESRNEANALPGESRLTNC